jgi:DNA-binding HxlR family transcriptional regulator
MFLEDGTGKSLSDMCDTDQATDIRQVLDRVGDKWSLLVIVLLERGTRRFMELRRDIGPISQRMLTRTLRQLEQDGLVERTVYPTVPPRVDYTLTPVGQTLLDAVQPLVQWATDHRGEVVSARKRYGAAQNEAA